jgi:DNA mismatch repair protein MutH
MNLPYKPDDPASIIAFAKLLSGKTLKQSCDITIRQHGFKGKGNFGQVLEKFYFLYTPNSDTEPDFKEAGLELKASPLKKLQNGSYRSKERLVLNIIKYHEIVKEEFLASSFWKKNAHLLLVFYLHEPDTDILDFMIRLVDGWKFSETDLEIIKKDWQKIRRKVAAGQAHELSEGDTFYLGACTKGKNADTKRQQLFSNTPAKQRAYSLKQGYVNHMIATIAGDATGKYGKLLSSTAEARKGGIEQTVLGRFSRFIGKTVAQIVIKTGVQ